MGGSLTRTQVAALLAVTQDHALGQPAGAQLRAAVLAQRLAAAAGLEDSVRAETWWTSTLRFLGCTGHAFDMAVVFGDEIEMRARAARYDFSNPFEVMRVMVSSAGAGRSSVDRLRSVLSVLAGGRKAAEFNFRTACEVAVVFAKRLGMDHAVLVALPTSFERWNGRGLPDGVKGTAIPISMRAAQLAQDLEVLARIEGITQAVEIIRTRRGRAYDPALTDIVMRDGPSWWEAIEPVDPWDAALQLAPASPPLDTVATREALLVLADFADLKSPWTGGHSRAVAALSREAFGPALEEAALVHDLGRVAVPNNIWDKPGPLTRDERDRVELHALVGDQLLRRVPYTAALAGTASAAHERTDASGYHRRLGAQLDRAQRVISAADCYQAMTSDRPHRPALDRHDAATELRTMSRGGSLDGDAVEAVLAAAGHQRSTRPPLPGGLTPREADVLRLVAVGLKTREIAAQLHISTKTADHHIQHTYNKIGVSTRGAATLFAIEHGLLASSS